MTTELPGLEYRGALAPEPTAQRSAVHRERRHNRVSQAGTNTQDVIPGQTHGSGRTANNRTDLPDEVQGWTTKLRVPLALSVLCGESSV